MLLLFPLLDLRGTSIARHLLAMEFDPSRLLDETLVKELHTVASVSITSIILSRGLHGLTFVLLSSNRGRHECRNESEQSSLLDPVSTFQHKAHVSFQ